MKKIIITILIAGIFIFSCDDRFEEMNRPKKNATSATGETLFASGVRNMFDMMVSTNVNENVFRLYAQYWAQTTYPDESQYNMVSREIPDNFWRNAYRDVLKDFDEAQLAIEDTWQVLRLTEEERDNQLAIIDICKVYTYAVLVDAFGAIPFTEALDPENFVPAYDPGADVYNEIIDMLDNAITTLDVDAPGFRGTQDPVYEGNVAAWIKFGNSLKLRLALTISDVNPTKAQTIITEALASGVFTSNADNTSITYYSQSPNTNPVWEDLVQSGRSDYVIANTIVDKLQTLRDPRLKVYAAGRSFVYPINKATGSKRDSTITAPVGNATLYYPGSDSIVFVTTPFTILAKDSSKTVRLFNGGTYGTGNAYAGSSPVGDVFHEPDLEGVILDYAEVQFLLAEAAAKGLTVPNTAESYYNAGITASMRYWGIDNDAINAYIARPDVAYATAPGDWKQKIGTQAWIALYNRGFEAWTLWRRLDFTGFNVPTGLTYNDIPKRLIFPIEEATLNPTSVAEARQLIGGTDDAKTKVFWDVN